MGTKKAGTKKSKVKKASKLGGVASKVRSVLGGGKKSGAPKRRRSVTYWSNKVLIEKLKKRYNRLKYGSVR